MHLWSQQRNYVDHILEYAIKHNPKQNAGFPLDGGIDKKAAGSDVSDLTHDVLEVDLLLFECIN
jgi:hypothetical protein